MQLSLPTDYIEQSHPSDVGLRFLGPPLHSLAKGFGHQESCNVMVRRRDFGGERPAPGPRHSRVCITRACVSTHFCYNQGILDGPSFSEGAP